MSMQYLEYSYNHCCLRMLLLKSSRHWLECLQYRRSVHVQFELWKKKIVTWISRIWRVLKYRWIWKVLKYRDFFRVRNCVIILVALSCSRKKFLSWSIILIESIRSYCCFNTFKKTETGNHSGFQRGQISNNSFRVEKYDFCFRLSVFESYHSICTTQIFSNVL